MLSFTGCSYKTYYAIRIYDGPDCASAIARAQTGGDKGRDGIPDLTCTGTTGAGRTGYSRESTDPKPWTIADAPTPTNLVGRVLVIANRDAPAQPLACGEIVRQAGTTANGDAALPPVAVSAELIGLCSWRNLVPDAGPNCPDANAAVDCAATHCALSSCVSLCSDHVACIEGQSNPCSTGTDGASCGESDGCAACITPMHDCLTTFCLATLLCSTAPTPGGPCSKVEACCRTQGDFAQQCLDGARQLEGLGNGDTNCVSAMGDWDFNAHLPVPCAWN
jgi:hypothetical protein